jgi:hypothetical protein
MIGRDPGEPDERSRKGAELHELQVESSLAIRKRERATAERERVIAAVRNTVAAVRREMT